MKKYFTSLFLINLLTPTILLQNADIREGPRLLSFYQIYKDFLPTEYDNPSIKEQLRKFKGPSWNLKCDQSHVFTFPTILIPLFPLHHSSYKFGDSGFFRDILRRSKDMPEKNRLKTQSRFRFSSGESFFEKIEEPHYDNFNSPDSIYNFASFVIARLSEELGVFVCVFQTLYRSEILSQIRPLSSFYMHIHNKSNSGFHLDFDPTHVLKRHELKMYLEPQAIIEACAIFNEKSGLIVTLPDLSDLSSLHVDFRLILNSNRTRSDLDHKYIYSSNVYITTKEGVDENITNNKKYTFRLEKNETKVNVDRKSPDLANKSNPVIPCEQNIMITPASKKEEIYVQPIQQITSSLQELNVASVSKEKLYDKKTTKENIFIQSPVPNDSRTYNSKYEKSSNKFDGSHINRSSSEKLFSRTNKKKNREIADTLQTCFDNCNEKASERLQITPNNTDLLPDAFEQPKKLSISKISETYNKGNTEGEYKNGVSSERSKFKNSRENPSTPDKKLVKKEQMFVLIIIVVIIGLIALIMRRFFCLKSFN
ncbi:hypothetical protein CDIK_2815 [Cucumispora dikerogammari]|nr:hypothetical protein CDIK_2815 [Cucumispora dikerogammari]